MKKIKIIAASIILLTGCATTVGMAKFDEIMIEKISRKASFTMQCAPEKLKITKIDTGIYGVTGCEKRSTFIGANSHICHHNNTKVNLDTYCKVVPDTYAENNKDNI